MTIIVVGNNSYTTSLVPTEQDAHDMEEHDADKTTPDVHDHIGNFKVTGSLTVDGTILTDGIQAEQGYFVDNSGATIRIQGGNQQTYQILAKDENDATTMSLGVDGLLTVSYGIVVPVIDASTAIEVRDEGTSASATLRPGDSDSGAIEVFNGTHTTFALDKDGQVEAHLSIGAPIFRADNRVDAPKILMYKENCGNVILGTPANNSEYYLQCGSIADNTVNLCQIDAVGSIQCNAITTVAGQHTNDNGNFSWTHSSGEGLLRLGRQQNHLDQTVGFLDGIHHQRTIDNVLHKFNQQLHPSEPKLTLSGQTNAGVDWMTITDTSTNLPVFAIHNDGTVETHAWTSPDTYQHPDVTSHTTATSASSLYVGKCKLSQLQGTLNVSHLRDPPYIPEVLTAAPYSFTSGNINANTSRTILDWMALARDALSGAAAKNLRIRDVFPESAASNDFASTDGYGFQPVGNHPTRIEVGDLYCDRIVPRSDTHLAEISVSTIKTKKRSLWLGDRIHISTDSGAAKIQYKNATVPLYLQGLTPAVTEADVTGLGATLATCTLNQWQDLSEASSGSRDLGVIFPIANTSADFETNSSFNQVKIVPDSDAGSGNSGLEIVRTTGHPLINLRGSDSGFWLRDGPIYE